MVVLAVSLASGLFVARPLCGRENQRANPATLPSRRSRPAVKAKHAKFSWPRSTPAPTTTFQTRRPSVHAIRRPTLAPDLLCPKHASSRPHQSASEYYSCCCCARRKTARPFLVTPTTVPAAASPVRRQAYSKPQYGRGASLSLSRTVLIPNAHHTRTHLLLPVLLAVLLRGTRLRFSRNLASPSVRTSARRRPFASSCRLTTLTGLRGLLSRPMARPIS